VSGAYQARVSLFDGARPAQDLATWDASNKLSAEPQRNDANPHHVQNEVIAMGMPERITLKAICGKRLSNSERAMLTQPLRVQLAFGGFIHLTPCERMSLPRTTLAHLAVAGRVELNRHERDRLGPLILAQLAVRSLVELQADELRRLPRYQRAGIERRLSQLRQSTADLFVHRLNRTCECADVTRSPRKAV
jgi:hypothetical protein